MPITIETRSGVTSPISARSGASATAVYAANEAKPAWPRLS
jgi:hypothetical protein